MPSHNKPQDQKRKQNKQTIPCAGEIAQAGPHTLNTMRVGCLPILNRILERMRLEQFFSKHLQPDGSRTRLSTPRALLVLVRNLLLSREPIYGIGEWAAQYAPDLLGLDPKELAAFNDDRLGRSLDRLFVSIGQKVTVVEIAGIVYGIRESLIPYSTMKVATDGYSSCQQARFR